MFKKTILHQLTLLTMVALCLLGASFQTPAYAQGIWSWSFILSQEENPLDTPQPFGYLTALSIGGAHPVSLNADLAVYVPEPLPNNGFTHQVALLDKVEWSGSSKAPITLSGYVSQANAALLFADIERWPANATNIPVTFSFFIGDYNPVAKSFYSVVQGAATGRTLSGVLASPSNVAVNIASTAMLEASLPAEGVVVKVYPFKIVVSPTTLSRAQFVGLMGSLLPWGLPAP